MQELRGVAASPGIAVGVARRVDAQVPDRRGERMAANERPRGAQVAVSALDEAAAQLEALAADLRRRHRTSEADIVETGVLMALDPTLRDAVIVAVEADGLFPPEAIVAATDSFARTLAALESGVLASRAADVRSLGRRAAHIAAGATASPLPGSGSAGAADHDVILIADDLGPADIAELAADVRGVALSQGAITTHAAIVARSLGLPAVVAIGDSLAGVGSGSWILVDGAAGTVVVDPPAHAVAVARTAAEASSARRDHAAADRDVPAQTTDGHRIHVLTNASSAVEVALALDAGAEGVGLLRTELGLLDTRAWPSVIEHRRMLEPVMSLLNHRPATVRLLDFGGDKLPPFLSGSTDRGVQLLRGAPGALEEQLEAILGVGARSDLGVLIPMVVDPDDVEFVRRHLDSVRGRAGVSTHVRIGAMVEVPAAVAMAPLICRQVDFLSIGTNDLTHFQLGLDRATARTASAHHPAVLRLIRETVEAAHDAAIPVAVCGEAASNPLVMPLLIGLGVDELSVGAARVGEVRGWVRALDAGWCRDIAQSALSADGAEAVEALSAPLRLSLLGEAVPERCEGGLGVVALGVDDEG